jgi:hypothetical protein
MFHLVPFIYLFIFAALQDKMVHSGFDFEVFGKVQGSFPACRAAALLSLAH